VWEKGVVMYNSKKCEAYFDNLGRKLSDFGLFISMEAGFGLVLFIMLIEDVLRLTDDFQFESIWSVIIPMLPGLIIVTIGDLIIPMVKRFFLWYIAEENRKARRRS